MAPLLMVSMKLTDFQRGQIWWVRHDPAIGSEPSQTRPSIVVSSPDHNEFMATVTVCPLTSSIRRIMSWEVFMLEGDGGIPKDSKVQPHLIRAVSKTRLVEYIGQASETTLVLVDEAIKKHLGFTP
jgi:mRNA interferase MazF